MIQIQELVTLTLLAALVFILIAIIMAFLIGFKMGRVSIGKATEVIGSNIKKTSQHILSEPDIFEEATNRLESREERVPTMRQ